MNVPNDLAQSDGVPSWWVYHGTGLPIDGRLADVLPPPPPWRDFNGGPVLPGPPDDDAESIRRLGRQSRSHHPNFDLINMVNAALLLRRPLLVTGRPGTGKSSLAFQIARELRLGRVLRWPITSSTSLANGLYEYDAIGRVQAASAGSGEDTDIGRFIHLGPLGTAMLPHLEPRVLLIDEIDKSDIDLPNDLLSVLEDGEFRIRELARLASGTPEVPVFTEDPDATAVVHRGRVRCRAFPVIVITSNGEREFPPAFLRRCLRLELSPPGIEQLAAMVSAHFPDRAPDQAHDLVSEFLRRSDDEGGLATDQLLNAVHLATSGAYQGDVTWTRLVDLLWRQLSTTSD